MSKVKYNRKTRKDFSNPYNKYTHEELLKLSKVKIFNEIEIVKLPNNKITVKEKIHN